jgi:hypothetical protein
LNVFSPKNWKRYYDNTILVYYDRFVSHELFYLNSLEFNESITLKEIENKIDFIKEDSYTSFIWKEGYLFGDITDISNGFKKETAITKYTRPLLYKTDIDTLLPEEMITMYVPNIMKKHIDSIKDNGWNKMYFDMYFENTIKPQTKLLFEQLKQKLYGIPSA